VIAIGVLFELIGTDVECKHLSAEAKPACAEGRNPKIVVKGCVDRAHALRQPLDIDSVDDQRIRREPAIPADVGICSPR
jgi:hypothetical protein